MLVGTAGWTQIINSRSLCCSIRIYGGVTFSLRAIKGLAAFNSSCSMRAKNFMRWILCTDRAPKHRLNIQLQMLSHL